MTNQNNQSQPQRVATPAYLLQHLTAFRIGMADRQTYVIRDNARGKSFDFEPWQFFVLEVLPGCADETKLSSVFEDRFGHPLARGYLDQFLASLADAKLFNEAAHAHPMLARFGTKTYVVKGDVAHTQSYQTVVAGQQTQVSGTVQHGAAAVAAASAIRPITPVDEPADEETLPAGMQGAPEFDPRATPWMWTWFNPTPLLKVIVPVLSPLRYLIFALPLTFLGALILTGRHAHAVSDDLERLLAVSNLLDHWLLSLLTVNLAVACTTAALAFHYRATVKGFGIALLMRFYPRFSTRIGHVDQLSRVERMWLHGAPLLMRMFLFSAGMYVWFATRGAHATLPNLALAMSMTAAVSFLFTANPLIKGNGYHLLAAFTNEPHLRGKAFKTLLNRLRGGAFKEANDLLLATYGISMAAFMFVLVAGAAAFTGFALHQLQLGGSAIIVASIVGFMLWRNVINYFSKVEAAYDRSLQFDRWRTRTHAEEQAKEEASAPSKGVASYVWKAAVLTFIVAMFLPYSYEAGGNFVVHPQLQQVITTDVSGRIEYVAFDGGETVAKGTVIARLAATDDQAQANIYEKKIAEQQAVLDNLAAYPRPEDIRVAKMAVAVERTRVDFSKVELARVKKLVDDQFAPREELDDIRRQLAVDKQLHAERQAELAVEKLGPTEFEVAEAQAKLESLMAERDGFLDRVRRSELVMPFDGRLLSLHLKEKGNSYYKSGDVFAEAEASGAMTAELEIPESEAEHVTIGSTVEFKPLAYSSRVFTGTVVHIDWDVTEGQFGNVIKIIAALDDEEGLLRNGMTGYAKVEGPSLLVWEAFSQQIVRFFEVQVWSWIP